MARVKVKYARFYDFDDQFASPYRIVSKSANKVVYAAKGKNGDIEKVITKKADVIAELKRSFEHLRNAVNATSDLEKPVKMFGTQTTHRGVLVTVLSHLHEHLGQSVAYARINGVVPPWSR